MAALLVFFVIIAVLSDGVYGGADNYTHYRLARYAFRYPEFFLDHWGKPVYTTLSSVFAQFGFNGAKVFNIICGLLTAYLLFLISRSLNYKLPILAIILLCSMPLYFLMMISSLTEILFSFIITLSTWLFLGKRYYVFAMVASFLPFVRTEGFFLLPIFAMALVAEKKIKAIPTLLTGTIFYSLVGSFYYDDILWVFNRMPYVDGAKHLYGSGALLNFVNSYKEITGLLPAILLVAGIAILIYQSFQKSKQIDVIKFEWLLVFLPFFVYLSMHSWLWWQGRGSSLGLIRVMSAVLPLAVLLCMKPINLIFEKLPNLYLRIIAIGILIFLIAREPLRRNIIPYRLSGSEAMVKEASDWMVRSEFFGKKIYYNDPMFCFFLDINPFDMNKIQEHVPDREHPELSIAEGEIVLWDAHFSPNEGKLPLERLKDNPHFAMVKKFEPAQSFKVLGEHDYAIYIFRRNDKK